MDIQQTVIKAKNGDKLSQQEIINKFTPYVIKAAASTYVSGYEMEDLKQIGYISILNAISKYNPDKNSNFTSYVITAIKNNFYYLIRREGKENYVQSLNKMVYEDMEMMDTIIDDYDLEEDYVREDEIKRLKEALKTLTKTEREIIEHAYLKGPGQFSKYCKSKGLNYSTATKRKKTVIKKLVDAIE